MGEFLCGYLKMTKGVGDIIDATIKNFDQAEDEKMFMEDKIDELEALVAALAEDQLPPIPPKIEEPLPKIEESLENIEDSLQEIEEDKEEEEEEEVNNTNTDAKIEDSLQEIEEEEEVINTNTNTSADTNAVAEI